MQFNTRAKSMARQINNDKDDHPPPGNVTRAAIVQPKNKLMQIKGELLTFIREEVRGCVC